MTSKSSSSNKPAVAANRQITIWQLTCKVIKRHIWLPVLAMLGFVLAFPVSTALCINNFMSYNGWNNVEPFCRDLLLLWQGFSVCIIVVGALLSAFVLFRYLHVRKQVDFYHSLPVRREKFFFSNLLAGLLVFLAPYLAAILLNFLVLAVSGWLSYLSVGHYLQYILFNVLVYLLFFGCGSLAMQLSGTMPSAFKVLLLTFGLAPLFACMFELLGACFFDTWVSFFSPVSVVMLKASVIERYVWVSAMAGSLYNITWQDWLAALLLTGGTLGASLWLYLRRRSEAAGSTLAFAWQKPFYKYPLVICGGIMLGVFFFLMGDRSSLWMYFGAVLGTMFMALLMEIFIQSDFKAIRKGWKAALATSAAVCVLLSVYAFDLTGFDSKVPDADKVQTVYISSNSLDSLDGTKFTSGYYLDDQDYFETYWVYSTNQFLERSNMLHFSDSDNVAAALAMVDEAQNTNANFEYDDYSWDAPVMTDSMLVICKMNNGSTFARRYWTYNVLDEVHQQAFEQLVGSQEWREQLTVNELPLDKLVLTDVSCYAIGQTENLYLQDQPNDDLAKQLVQTMQAEYAKLSADDILYSAPLGSVEISTYDSREYVPEENWYNYTGMRRCDVMIFPQMTETIALLNEHFDNIMQLDIDLANVVEVREYHKISQMAEAYEEDDPAKTMKTSVVETTVGDSFVAAVYKPDADAAAIEQILQNSVRERAIWNSAFWTPRMYDTYYEVSYYDDGEYVEDVAYNANRDLLTITLYPTPNRELWNRLVYGE